MVTASIAPDLKDLIVDIHTLTPYPANPRNGDLDAIRDSLTQNGQFRPIVVNKGTHPDWTGNRQTILAGNHTYAAALEAGWQTIAATFVNVSDDDAKRIVIVDNRTTDLASYDDPLLVELLQSLPSLDGTGFDTLGFDALAESVQQAADSFLDLDLHGNFERPIQSPVYTPTGDCPAVCDLYDDTRTRELLAAIDTTPDLPEDLRRFLYAAAHRHTVLHFGHIAEYYAHANQVIQTLFEDSAVVIIDFNQAIEKGFVVLTGEIAAQVESEHEDDTSES